MEAARGRRRTVAEILAERRGRLDGRGGRPAADAELQWEAIETIDDDVGDVRAVMATMQADVAFVARATRMVIVGAPPAAAVVVLLSQLGVI